MVNPLEDPAPQRHIHAACRVCGRWALPSGVDIVILRNLLVAATALSPNTPMVIYMACWLLPPCSHSG